MQDNDMNDAILVGLVTPCPAGNPEHWLEFNLEDKNGNPVPNEKYVVITPDGKKEVGYLDGKGWAKLAPLECGGTCSVSFPNLDKSLWRYDRSAK